MLNRRELIAASVALPLTARDAAAGFSATAAAPATVLAEVATAGPATHFLAATAFAEARSQAQAAAAGGAHIVWVRGDITPAYEWLDTALRPAPFAVAGLTTSHDFFIFERLAWDRGLRTVHRRELPLRSGQASAVEWRLEPRVKH